MASPYAFVTLLTSDSYLPGALTLAAALKDIHPTPPVHPEVEFQTVCLVTPETVDVSVIKLLRRAFNVVIGVEIIASEDNQGFRLLGESFVRLVPRDLGNNIYKPIRWESYKHNKRASLHFAISCLVSTAPRFPFVLTLLYS
jgi:hypothetical protein